MNDRITRRQLIKSGAGLALLAALQGLTPRPLWGGELAKPRPLGKEVQPIDLVIADTKLGVDGRMGKAMTVNGTLPGPLIRLREGQEAVINVTNRLAETSSIHWHGLLVPTDMDGVPGVSFAGIKPGETFTYRFPVKQYGTYWYHSHSGGQELLGVYAPIIVEPSEPEPFKYDRDYIVMLSDWSFESPARIISNLKALGNYYNRQRRTVSDFFRDVSHKGLGAALSDYESWSRMRMDPTDLADVTGVTLHYLMNGLSPATNWTGIFKGGERIRLRFINAGASTYFDVRIPGLELTVVEADGQYVELLEVDEFRISPAETYDVIVEPKEETAYTIFAEAMDRSGYARGTLAPRAGMAGVIPPKRQRPVLSMKDMGMDMKGMDMEVSKQASVAEPHATTPGMSQSKSDPMAGVNMAAGATTLSEIPGSTPVPHSKDRHGVGNQTVPMTTQARLDEAGVGLGKDGWRVLVYADLKSTTMRDDMREPEREIELHLTGNMERFMWSFDGKKYSEAKTPIPFRYGERTRLTLVNDTMMAHPIHLHGMWMELENGQGHFIPRKHTINVKPAERVSVAITADAPGRWALHCHLLLHMEMGMFRVIEVSDKPLPEVVK